jgi:PAS domain S-box-containing protein
MTSEPAADAIDRLAKQLSQIEAAINREISDQIDVVIDPQTSTPLLLRHAQEALISARDELDRQVQERTAELQKTIAKLEEITRRYELVIAGSTAAIWDWDLLSKRVMYSPQWKALRGFGEDDVGDGEEEWRRGVHPEDAPRVFAAVEAHLQGLTPVFAEEYRIRCKDGSWKWIFDRGIAQRNAAGRAVRMAGSEEDITDRKRSAEALKASEERARDQAARLQAVLDAAPAMIWTAFDPECRNISGNQKAYEFSRVPIGTDMSKTGSQPEMLEHYRIFKDGVELAPEEMPLQRVAASGHGINNCSIDFNFDNGTVRSLLGNVTPILDSNGQSSGAVSAFMDVTELRKIEEELCKAKDELEIRVKERTAELQDAKENLELINEELQAEISGHEKTEKALMAAKEDAEAAAAAKAAFLANMSHELRTPMNAVIGFTSLLLDESLPSELKEYIEGIRAGGEAMMAVINEILEFSRTDKEKIELDKRPFSLKHCIESSLDMVASKANQKGLSLSYTISYGTPDGIIGDHGRLRQILVNLLGNAVKFTDEGRVSVTVCSKPIEANRHRILFSVKDTGIGIHPDAMETIFEPFTQVEHILSLKRDGVGLGLPISKKLVELMGGEIWAENDPDQGATFHFTIQAEICQAKWQEPGGMAEALHVQDPSKFVPMSILVAEDNPSNQKVLVQMLQRMGYRPDAVSNGKEVIQAFKLRPYDLIFMDVKMPEMDGITVTKVIRKVWPETGPKIIAITAYALEGDRELCLEAGMDGYIAKPVMASDLVEALKKHQPSQDSQ